MDKLPFTVYDFFAYLSSGAVVLAALDYIWGTGVLAKEKISTILGVALIVFAYVVGHVVAQLSSTLLERLFVKSLLGSPNSLLLGGNPRWGFLRRIFPNYNRPLPTDTQDRVWKQVERRGVRVEREGLFLHAYALVSANDKMQARLDDFRNQYGFARNMAMSFLIAAIAIYIAHRYGNSGVELRWALLSAIGFVCFVYRYLKFYRQYSYELFLRYAELP